MKNKQELSRSLSLLQITFYGLGTILGAGIYVLVGKIAASAGIFTPVAFLLAGVIAAFSAFSYAELSSRFPESAGAAYYLHKGFNIKMLSTLAGIGIVLSGVVSAGVLTHGFVGYLHEFVMVSDLTIILGVIVLLCGLAVYGINASAWMITLITTIEVAGLLLIIWVARDNLVNTPELLSQIGVGIGDSSAWFGIFVGTFLAFYAFIGFEDMVNVAEETKNVKSTLPKAIIISLVAVLVLYVLIAFIAVLSLNSQELANSKAPLALIYEKSTNSSPVLITVIGLFAIVNGIIAQIIMASRILYGMSKNKWIPKIFGSIYSRTKTPVFSTIFVSLIILFFVLLLPILSLASITSFITLLIFAFINLALWNVKRNIGDDKDAFTVPIWVPALGFIFNICIVGYKAFIVSI